MKQESAPNHMDVKAFAQSSSELSGRDLLSKYERLMQETQGLGAERGLDWSVRGEFRTDDAGSDQVWLHLEAGVSLPLTCQRCLGPVDVPVHVNRSFRFVANEEAAEAQDDESEEDVLVLSRDFSLSDLIEDEVLMELPVVPRHEECPGDVKLEVADAGFEEASAVKRNPFAVLSKLQGGKTN
jgi:uncharacterized protein